jgi:hypothetical protein
MLAMRLPVSPSKAKLEAAANQKLAGTFKVVNVYCRVYLLLDIYLTLLPSIVSAQKRKLLRRRIGGAKSLCFGQFIYRKNTLASVIVDSYLVSRGTRQ